MINGGVRRDGHSTIESRSILRPWGEVRVRVGKEACCDQWEKRRGTANSKRKTRVEG